uniref:Nuclear speckle splicing regulatory protein 1 N-terminal domain-containing protein n=1 Tax=Globodera rostochiensis TaxID=31243 RepID=A0A914GZR5_GLORO
MLVCFIIKMSAGGKFRMGLNVRKSVVVAADGSKKTANVFGDSAESDDEGGQSAADKFERKFAASASIKAREQRLIEKELAENPDIFDYDAHYEQIQQQRDQKVAVQKEADKEKKPKYAHLLTKAHKQRELNRLLVDENTYKKEREREAGQFDDDEVFVTGAYRQQIEEREQHKVEMEREEALEKMCDVRDQRLWQQAFNRTLLDNISRNPSTSEGLKEEKDEEKTVVKTEGDDGWTEVQAMEEERVELKLEEVVVQREGEGAETHGDERRRRFEREEDDDARKRRQRPSSSLVVGGHRRRERKDKEEAEDDGKRGGRTAEEGRKKRARLDESVAGGGGVAMGGEQPKDAEGEEEELRMARIRQLLARRNDQRAIEEAKQRHLERRAAGEIRAPRIEEKSD